MATERNLNFDTIVNRRHTHSLKYDFAVQRGHDADILPLWVADMDFPTASFITDALKRRAEYGIFGYTEAVDDYFDAVKSWFLKHHGWEVKEDWLLKTPGVVFALAMCIKAFSAPGDAVLIQQPVYYPFSQVIEDNGRIPVSSDLVLGADGRYSIDFENFEQTIVKNNVHLFLFCNPHNPVGRVWNQSELQTIADICLRHNVLVVSDEIHEDLTFFGHRHIPYASLGTAYEQQSIICTAPSKTFNLAGLQFSNIFIPNPIIRKRFQKEIDAAGYSQQNTFGVVACEAAYRGGEEWYQAMLSYVEGNILFVQDYLQKNMPAITMTPVEGTYLVWLNCRGLGLSDKDLNDFVEHKAGLWLDSGNIFGSTGEGFERINVACPRATLIKALEQFYSAAKDEGLI